MAKKKKADEIDPLEGFKLVQPFEYIGKTALECQEERDQLAETYYFLKNTKRSLTKLEVETVEKALLESPEDCYIIFSLYNECFGTRIKPCKCPDQIKNMLEKLEYKAAYDKLGHQIEAQQFKGQ